MSYAEQEAAMARASIEYQQHIDMGMEAAYGAQADVGAPYGPYFPDLRHSKVESTLTPTPDPGCEPDAEPSSLLDDQEEAYEYLIRTLSDDQRAALRVLSVEGPVDALHQLLDRLWGE
ncbi:hypothetical protein [Streptomyces griseiscabiei]|uniref:Uncharacterized protein n=1 Tax=Streptomyces griseiscabiei TaxID=2993540 RepID=A0ABU4LDD4_9ACTN|nr:hypothetical protein [Streptomyces griseiscabiei]MBZ3906717.1 hypothetical protein [Streptomyces griseiscabiei]MDX2913782.1 hypothetical protein [Streptomyces griseiscabiei]